MVNDYEMVKNGDFFKIPFEHETVEHLEHDD